MVKGTVTPNANGTVRWTAQAGCMGCGIPVAVDQLDAAAVAAWQAGELADRAFPNMSAGEREALVSGTHAKCFDEMFPEEEDDEDDFPEYELP